jgi:hypothetical protein
LRNGKIKTQKLINQMTKRNYSNKLMAVAGAVAMISAGGHAVAETGVDALLNKLQQKGVLTADEAKELKAENEQNSAAEFSKAMNSRFPMPNWIDSYRIYGDFRGRFEKFSTENSNAPDRDRLRYRLRVGIAVNLKDNLEVGFRLASGDTVGGFPTQTGNPTSANTTFQDDFTRKFIYVDAAYGKWMPLRSDDWKLTTTIGKMDNPFRLSNMVFDYDINPEGVALQFAHQFNKAQSLSFNTGMFVMDEEPTSSHDPIMYGAQLIWDAKWASRLESSVSISALDIVNRDMLTTANVPYYNQGNTRDGSGNLVYNYNPIIGGASLTYKLPSFPLYKGEFPIKLAGEYMENPAAPTANKGYWAGITFGKAGTKKTWSIAYRYQELQSDAWFDQMVDDDNSGYYFNAPTGGKSGYLGGTNVKGHLIVATYSFTDSLSFIFTGYINDLVNSKPGGIAQPQNHAFHGMADFMWKF